MGVRTLRAGSVQLLRSTMWSAIDTIKRAQDLRKEQRYVPGSGLTRWLIEARH